MGYKDQERQRAYQAETVRRHREEWLTENGPCAECGSWSDLQVDHIDPAQKISHRIWSWSAARRTAELAKCQVLCGPCHRAKTSLERLTPHGTRGRYKRGCRCGPCRAASARYAADLRARRKVKGLRRGVA